MDVETWLNRIGLGRYASAFAKNDIDGAALRHLTADDLRELGVVSVGHRKKLLAEIARLPTPEQERGPAPDSYTPRHLAEQILRSRAALEGERKQVTVLFADVVGSTQMIHGMDPELAAARLSPAVQAMMAAVHRYDGTVNKVQGDGIMALFGAPLAHEDHALRACLAALTMQETIQNDGLGDLDIRVGLHSGEVVVRSIGNDLSMDYDAIGPTVHLAGRMEQLAAPGTICLSRDTYRLVEGFVQVTSLGPMSVKGIGESVEVFELTGSSSPRSAWEVRAARGLSEFVGREAELAILKQALKDAERGRDRLIAIVGEPGLGKSRLAHEFVRAAATEGWVVLEGGSSPYDRNTTYFPIRGLLRAWFEVNNRDTQDDMIDKLRNGLASLDPDLLSHLPAVKSLLDLPSDVTWQALEPSQRRRQIIEAVKTLLLRRAEAGRLVVLIEDLHWTDAETQTVLDSLVSAPTTQMLLMVTYRPEYRHAWPTEKQPIEVALRPLSAEAADRLVCTLVGGGGDLRSLRRLLVDRTGGTPLFIEEAVRSLIEQGAILGDHGNYRLAARIDEISVPTSVQTVLAARIDKIPTGARTLLQIASVVGAEIPVDLLRLVADLPQKAVEEGLVQLCSSELLYESHLSPELSYSFKHALVRDVAYQGMLLERRRALHARLLTAIETLHRNRLDEHTERLAHHAWTGEVWDKAASYLRRAGDRAIERSAYRQAAVFFRQALQALAQLPAGDTVTAQAIDTRIKLRPTLVPIGEADQVLDYLREAEQLAKTAGDSARLGSVLIHQSYFHSVQGSIEPAVTAAQQAADIVAPLAKRELAIETRIALGQAYCHGGQLHRAIEVLTPDLECLTREFRHERFGQIGTRSVISLFHLAKAHEQLGDLAKAIGFGNSALSIADEVNRPFDIGLACFSLGSALLVKGEMEKALPVLERGREVTDMGEISYISDWLAATISYAHAVLGNDAKNRALIEHAVERSAAKRLKRHEAQERAYLSYAYQKCNAWQQAAEEAKHALKISQQHCFLDIEVLAYRVLGMIEGAGDEREVHLRKAIALAESRAMRPELAHSHHELGKWLARTRRFAEARQHLRSALALYRELDIQFWTPQVEIALSEIG